MSNENLIPLLSRLLKLLHVPVTDTTIRTDLLNHPEINSLATISHALNRWKVPHAAYRVSSAQLADLPTPFIAQFGHERSGFFLVQDRKDGRFLLSDEQGQSLQYTPEELGRVFSGVVLVCDANEDSGERDFTQKKAAAIFTKVRPYLLLLLAMASLAVALTASGYLDVMNWRMAALSATKLLGLVTAVLLFRESIGQHSAFIKKFCGGEQVNCGQVLASPGARFFWNLLSWADAGLLYFSATALLLFFHSSPAAISLLALFSLACLPYTVFSIYYQARVLRKWCLLCCIIQGLFWIEAVLFLPYLHGPLSIPAGELAPLFLSLALPFAFWLLLKPLLAKASEAEGLTKQLNIFLLNEQLFHHVLRLQPRHDLPSADDSIVLGAPDSENIITIILSPYCDYCADLYTEVEDWLLTEPEAELRIVFRVGTSHEAEKTEVVRHLIGLQQEQDELLPKALGDWYKTRDYTAWSRHYPLQQPVNAENILSAQAHWCAQEGITQTPLVLVDGYELPEPYDLQHLQTLLS